MRTLLFIAMLLGSQSQQDAKTVPMPPFQILLSTDTPTVNSGEPISLNIKLTNNSDRNINCSTLMERSGLDASYTYQIRNPDGKDLSRQDDKVPGLEGRIGAGSFYPCTLPPDQSISRRIHVTSRRFDFRKPGVYTIRVSRANEFDPAGPRIQSNEITVTVQTH